MKILSNEQNQILNILSNTLFSNNQVIEEVDYANLLDLAYIQSVYMQVYPVVCDKLEGKNKEKYLNIFLKYVANNTKVEEEHILLNNKLSKNSIDFVLFKGCASASYYKEPELRILGDVDFWINKADVEKAKNIFGKEYTCNDERKGNHISFVKETNDIKEVYEAHTLVNGIPDNSVGEILRSYFDNILDERVVLKLDNGELYVPSDFHHGLILLIHMSHHMTHEGIGLRHLCDFAVFVNSFSDEDFFKLFKEKFEKVGLWKFTQIMTLVCSKYLGLPYKKWASIDNNIDKLLIEIIVDIFESGNFGHNDLDRYRQIKYMNTSDTDSKAKMMSESLFQKVEREYPVVKTKKVLYIKYTAKVAFDYLIKVIKKERRIDNVSDVIEGANKRKEIYEKLALFDINE